MMELLLLKDVVRARPDFIQMPSKDEIIVATHELSTPMSTPVLSQEKSDSNAFTEAPQISKARFWLVFITLSMVLSINGIDSNVLGDAAPQISTALKTDRVSWLATLALITAAVLMLPVGWVYSKLEPRWLLFTSLLVMSAGQALAGSANSFNIFVAGRVLNGVSRGSTVLATYLIVGLICNDPRRRALFLSLVTALYGIMIKVGPLVAGGFLHISPDDWRWCFYVTLPIAALCSISILVGFPDFRKTSLVTEDAEAPPTKNLRLCVSSVLQGIFVLSLLLPCLLGGTALAYDSGVLITSYALVVPSLVLFILWERKSDESGRLLPWDVLIRDWRLSAISVVTFSAILQIFAGTFFIPIVSLVFDVCMAMLIGQYFQVVYNSSPLHAAVQMLPLAVSGTVACVVVGKVVERTGSYWYSCVVGSCIQILGSALFYTVKLDTPLRIVYGYQIVLGAGCGGLSAIGNAVAAHGTTKQNYVRCIAWINFVILMAASIGIGIQGALLVAQISLAAKKIETILGAGVDTAGLGLGDWLQYLHVAAPTDPIVVIGRAHVVIAQQQASLMYLIAGVLSLAASLRLPNKRL